MIAPPRVSQDFDMEPFADGLEEIIPEKIQEIVMEMDALEDRLLMWQEAVTNLKKKREIDEFGSYFWLLWAELEFADYDVYKKWLNYWLDIDSKIPRKTPRRQFVKKDFALDNQLQLERAKERPIENYYSGDLRGAGSRLNGKCPFHDERTPSFFIFTNDNHYHCFSCNKHGDVIDFIMKTRGFTFVEAVQFLS